MFEQFSSGYYLGRLYVEPRDDGDAAIARAQHEQVNEQLYAGDGIERTDLPLVMKLGSTHFAVRGDESVPADTLAVPESIVEASRIRNPPTLREVFLAKAERARQLLTVAEGTPTSEEAVDAVTDDGGLGSDSDFEFGGRDGPAGI